ncbi:TetR/AcrR family transcriptional regulator [Brevibacterium salitolerans]|uniref:HTH tetR-type domain-containing protein n=1 Tax=Brevibacterium salitolerans TaxID=1403566 RepID=A0ABP5ITF8_9MICO
MRLLNHDSILAGKERSTLYRSTPRTRQNAADRAASIAEAARALLTESGFASATVKSVAARAGCSPGLLYTYFPDRAALLRGAFAHAAGHELAAVTRALEEAETVAEAASGLVSTFISRALAGARLADALLFEALPADVETERLSFRTSYAAAIAARLQAGVDAGEIPEQDTGLTARALSGALSGCLQEPIHDSGRSEFSEAEAAALIADMTVFTHRAIGVSP